MPDPTLVWFRQDLRLADNLALRYAADRGGPAVCAYIWSPEEEGEWPPGAASRWWLHQSLVSLEAELRGLGQRLILRRGPAGPALRQLVKETSAGAVVWNRRYEPATIARDTAIKSMLGKQGLDARSFNSSLLIEPWQMENRQGDPYKVFTPYWRALLDRIDVPPARSAPTSLPSLPHPIESLSLDSFELEPRIDWAAGIRKSWQPGRKGALANLGFVKDGMARYEHDRDLPDRKGTSRLSPHLHFGEIGPREIWHRAQRTSGAEAAPFLRQLIWREFTHHLLYHYPSTPTEPLRPEFAKFPWQENPAGLGAWQRGETGYPIVDAGMRELWTTGWMHNRVRMIVASFLSKHLLVPWWEGARWFWGTLVDADLANNTFGWQWVAGSGADAAPYFRIFNPTLQGKKFDPDGAYVRRWVPELQRLSPTYVHAPWTAPGSTLEEAGVVLDRTYPAPIIDHGAARARALAAYQRIRGAGRSRSLQTRTPDRE